MGIMNYSIVQPMPLYINQTKPSSVFLYQASSKQQEKQEILGSNLDEFRTFGGTKSLDENSLSTLKKDSYSRDKKPAYPLIS